MRSEYLIDRDPRPDEREFDRLMEAHFRGNCVLGRELQEEWQADLERIRHDERGHQGETRKVCCGLRRVRAGVGAPPMNNVIAAKVYSPKETTDEEVAKRACDLVQRHSAKGLLVVEDVCPVEFHECGSLVIRIADGKGRSLRGTYKPDENQ